MLVFWHRLINIYFVQERIFDDDDDDDAGRLLLHSIYPFLGLLLNHFV